MTRDRVRAVRERIGPGPLAILALGCLLFLGLRFQRVDRPAAPQADEGVYLHVARHLHDSRDLLASWYFIHRGGIFPSGGPPYPESIVQPGLPALLAPLMGGQPHRDGRRMIFLLGVVGLACSVFALGRIGGPWAAAGCALFTGLSYSQLEYGTLIHTETPMTLAVYASLAVLAGWLPVRPLAAAAVAGALAGLGLWFRTNGIFPPLAMAFCLFLRRRDHPRAWTACLAASSLVMAPLLLYSSIRFGSPLASDSGDILWAASLEDFRSAHPAPLDLSHLVRAGGWSEVMLRPFVGTWALISRIIEADHGRNAPILALGLVGCWMRRKHIAMQSLVLGTLPTLCVAIWVSPVSWCDRYIFFLMPALYGMAGSALSGLAARFLPQRLTGPVATAAVLGLAIPYLPPHRFLQRQLAADPPAADRAASIDSAYAELDRRLAAEGPVFLVGTDFSRQNWRRPFAGANLPARTPADSVGPVLESLLGVRPTHLILSRPEELRLDPREADWLAPRLRFRAGGYAVFTLSKP